MGAGAAVPPAEGRYLVTYGMSRGRITCTVAVWHLGLAGCWEREREIEKDKGRERDRGREREREG